MKMLLVRMLDEAEFLSPHGVRSLSRAHKDEPFSIRMGGRTYSIDYEPAESRTGTFGGNSNWRGPLWMPVNALLIESLLRFDSYYGPDFKVECPVGSGQMRSLAEVAAELRQRLIGLFLRGPDGVRPSMRNARIPQAEGEEEALLFYEFFNGDTGEGLGASHQTGWTGMVALLIHEAAQAAKPSNG
jgi:hypothetical protein